MVKVFFDHQCFWERYGGVSRYFTEILKSDYDDSKYELAIKYSNNEYLKELNYSYSNFLPNLNIPKKHYIISAMNKTNSIRKMKYSDCDIVHLTHYDPYLFKYVTNKKIVSTIHDLNFFTIPKFFRDKTNLLKKWQVECIEKSNYLITISNNSKKDLMNLFGVPEQKISVIYHGVSPCFKKSYDKRIFPHDYILFVGRRDGYKNFDVVLKAFLELQLKYNDIYLICTGNNFTNKELVLFDKFHILDKIKHINATEQELINLYPNALLFVFPSFYEGFGFPLLEAMGCECPVLCSNASCFPEIGKDAVYYFNPNDVSDCYNKMTQLLSDKSLRELLIKKGTLQKQNFSWESSRNKHFELYKKLAMKINL